jgi:hypothetical protein
MNIAFPLQGHLSSEPCKRSRRPPLTQIGSLATPRSVLISKAVIDTLAPRGLSYALGPGDAERARFACSQPRSWTNSLGMIVLRIGGVASLLQLLTAGVQIRLVSENVWVMRVCRT